MDILSEVLRTVRFEGAIFFNAELTAPWCLIEPRASEIAPYLSSNGGRVVLYHFVTEGRAFARLPSGTQVQLTAGDIVVFPGGDEHVLGNGRPEKPVDSMRVFAANMKQGLKLARFGGGGEITRIICGYMVTEPHLSEVFLAGLPKILKVRVSDEASGRWLEDSIRFSVGDGEASAGVDLVLAKLSEVLFVETLRRYINSLSPVETGWLAGARDTVVGKALLLLHSRPEHPWTVADLAREVGSSRTQFAERFQHFLGESPMSYLTRWRLRTAAEKLIASDAGVAEIAGAVGYGSEATFNRAFKREFGSPPARYRREYRIRVV